MTDDPAIIERLARIETEISTMREENRQLRTTLHDMIGRSLGEHSAAITRLAAAHDQRLGIWWALVSMSAILIMLLGAIAWFIENKVEIVLKP